MATLQDIVYSASINLLSAIFFLLAFAILRLQPINDRVYFPKWYLKGIRASPTHSRASVSRFVNMDFRTYIRFLNWMPAAWRMPELELIDHAGLDSVVYIRIYLMGLKIFVPITILAFAVLVPVNWTGGTLERFKDLTFSDIDKLSISNIPPGSQRFCAHVLMSYVFTFWTLYVIYKEYKTTAVMRLQFLASESRRPDQFTVLVRNVPPDPDESVAEHVEHFFCVNHPDHYLSHQVVYNANNLANLVERKKTLLNWLTYHQNKYERNPSSKPTTKVSVVFGEPEWMQLTTIPLRLKNLQKKKSIKSLVQGILPGIALKIFLVLLPIILMIMSKIEGFTSLSSLDRRSAVKYHLFLLVNVFVGSIVTGTAMDQLKTFLSQSATEIPKIIGVSIPLKATFFITYIMVDGWAAIAAEILRLVPLIMFHLKNTFLVKTDQDREQAMDPGCLDFATSEPRVQFYFLLGLVYAAVTPLLLPFIIVFFAFSYTVFRHQIINVYNQKYESGAAFWPDVHMRLIIGLLIAQLLLLGLISTREAGKLTLLLVALPVLTIWFHVFCKGRFESAFVKFPLQDAMVRDTLERATDPHLNLKLYLQDAYVHPVFKDGAVERPEILSEEEDNSLVPTTRNSQKSHSKYSSDVSSGVGS
ncbi:CSC1-like protein At4g02900 isoform X2 [Manihot esculenta]|uniref:Uncharacterized protein n=3 Tax=Manihot esculenta TaxID=3983 RepID=A0ACB7IEB7_MANES|nr:CSC1-like protein At4g02900 isoform X2 [Manihot esculenta]KAG8663422.1 hypothetical protein MANES_01G209900v8 [Manihot esculenta]KAG8663423.1 hypothetical protein MANES_01G209900v8 [Manihot esculenta]KAG8663424.1 hypothetical protein MANES_01G209900v8 [Manihot esculenta]